MNRSRSREQPSAVVQQRWVPYAYLLPALLFYVGFLLAPVMQTGVFSLYDWPGFGPAEFIGFGNYADLMGDKRFFAAMGHSLYLILFYAILPLIVGLVLAAILRRGQVKGMGFFRVLIFIPQVIALVVVAVAWRQIYRPNGTLNQLLGLVGIESDKGWLGDPNLALTMVGVIGFWISVGLVMLLLLAGMNRIPNDLYEAARLDGAGPIREFFAITLPAVKAEISTALVLTIIAALKTFDLIYMTTSGGPGAATTVPSFEVYNRAFQLKQVGSASSVAIVLAVLVFLLNVLVNRIGEEGRK